LASSFLCIKEEECLELVQRALESGMHGDNASGNTLNLVVIDKAGARKIGPIVPSFTRAEVSTSDYTFPDGSTQVLKAKLFPI